MAEAARAESFFGSIRFIKDSLDMFMWSLKHEVANMSLEDRDEISWFDEGPGTIQVRDKHGTCPCHCDACPNLSELYEKGSIFNHIFPLCCQMSFLENKIQSNQTPKIFGYHTCNSAQRNGR